MKKLKLRMWYKVGAIGIGVFLCLAASFSIAQEARSGGPVDAVWSQSDGIRPEIFFSQSQAGQWSEPVMITDDYFDNLYPVIDQDSTGRKWVFWTAYDNKRMDLRYTTGSNGNWSENKTLETATQSNVAPSVIIDPEDAVWLVWSAGDGSQDDIYFSVNRNGTWTAPELLHASNQTPDALPVIELSSEGKPRVTWKSMQNGLYVTLASEFDDGSWSKGLIVEAPDQPEDVGSQTDLVELPDFIPQSGMVFLRIY